MFKALVLSLSVLATMTIAHVPQTGDAALLARARALHAQVPLIDGHNDYPWAVRENVQRDLDKLDISQPQPTIHTDIARLKAGGVGGQFWSVYTPSEYAGQTAVTATLEQIDIVHQMMRRYPETFELALTAADVERIFKSGKIASMIGMEGGHSIDNSLAALRMFHRLGARYMTLTHSKNTPWADSATDTPQHGGLTAFGEQVVREMNWLGMLVDLSHVSPDTMADAVRVSEAPVIFSHSSARAVNDVPRNVPDNVLQMLPKNGGIVMVTFVPGFLSPKVTAWNVQQGAETTRLQQQFPNDEAARRTGLEAWTKAHPAPRATVADTADHIDHIRKVAGIDHVGLGGDYDGITSVPEGLEDVSTYPALTVELLRRGYKDDEVKKILGLNILRVMKAAEAVSATERTRRGPSAMLFQKADNSAAWFARGARRGPSGPASFFGCILGRGACTPNDSMHQRTIIVAMGDSTTAGTPGWKSRVEAPPQGAGDEQSQYAWWLMQAHPEWEVLNHGVNGERSDQIRGRFERDVIEQRPRAVVIIAGVNDVYQGREAQHVIEQLAAMFGRAKREHIPVVAGTIIPYNTATAEQNARMRAINDWIRTRAAEDPAVSFVDTRAAAAAAGDPDALFESPDGLHPSAAGYRRMADAIRPVLEELLINTVQTRS